MMHGQTKIKVFSLLGGQNIFPHSCVVIFTILHFRLKLK